MEDLSVSLEKQIGRNNNSPSFVYNDNGIILSIWENRSSYHMIIKKMYGDDLQREISLANNWFDKDSNGSPTLFHGYFLIEEQLYYIEARPQDNNQRIDLIIKKENYLIPSRENGLPHWYTICCKQFGNQGGRQEDIRQTFRFNDEDWKKYFCDSSYQSSFVASYNIVKNLLQNQTVREAYKDKDTISIIDIGCGVGGATVGVLSAIEELLPNVKNIFIDAFDYNAEALSIFNASISNEQFGWKKYTNKQISFKSSVVKLVPNKLNEDEKFTFKEFSDFLNTNGEKYNFALCFKMINELICPQNNLGFYDTAYYHMCEVLNNNISDLGFSILLDISMSAETEQNNAGGKKRYKDNTPYCKLFNNQAREFIKCQRNNYRIVIPIPCGLSNNCICECLPFKTFLPIGGRRFPASYKVIAKKKFADMIFDNIQRRPQEYTIMYTTGGELGKCKFNTYGDDFPNEPVLDGYTI